MAYGDCSGEVLPDKRQVNCDHSVHQLGDCCEVVMIDEEIMLFEKISKTGRRNYYYWFFLRADETAPLVVCALEQYAKSQGNRWLGRRADYLAIGWYNSECYIVLIELRHVLLSKKQQDDKLEQLEQSINTVVSTILPDFRNSDILAQACYPLPPPAQCRIIGIVVPPERSKSSLNRKKVIEIAQYKGVITTLPSTRLNQCRISWSELLGTIIE